MRSGQLLLDQLIERLIPIAERVRNVHADRASSIAAVQPSHAIEPFNEMIQCGVRSGRLGRHRSLRAVGFTVEVPFANPIQYEVLPKFYEFDEVVKLGVIPASRSPRILRAISRQSASRPC